MARKTHKPEATFGMTVNGHRLTGERWSGRWVLTCKSFPDVAARHQDAADASAAIEEFVRRATAGAVA